jgi:hypothetical protein
MLWVNWMISCVSSLAPFYPRMKRRRTRMSGTEAVR